jgi:hypothetical protein
MPIEHRVHGADGRQTVRRGAPGAAARFKTLGVLLAADAKPHRGTTLTEAAWAELLELLKSPRESDVVEAIRQLDLMSGGRGTGLTDFERSQALTAIAPLLGAKSVTIATAR